MIDKKQVYERFADCYSASKPADLVKALNLKSSTISNWKTGKKRIPWTRLKNAVDEFNVNWDWLLEGKQPKMRSKLQKRYDNQLNRDAISCRFMDLFRDMSQADFARLLDVSPVAAFYMFEETMQVPWDKLSIAVDVKGITWEWLLEGHGPQKKSTP